MANASDNNQPLTQVVFEQRILKRMEALGYDRQEPLPRFKPLISYTMAELMVVADGLETTVEWLLTGNGPESIES